MTISLAIAIICLTVFLALAFYAAASQHFLRQGPLFKTITLVAIGYFMGSGVTYLVAAEREAKNAHHQVTINICRAAYGESGCDENVDEVTLSGLSTDSPLYGFDEITILMTEGREFCDQIGGAHLWGEGIDLGPAYSTTCP